MNVPIRLEIAADLESRKFEILKNWEDLSRQKVEAARAQSRLALRDSMPQFLDQLVETLASEDPKSEKKNNAQVACEHAEDRSNQPEYSLDQVIAEYHILRSVIIEHVDVKGHTDFESRRIIHEFIDLGISKAAVRYTELENRRQKEQTSYIQASKLEAERASQAKSAFLANMSHEIRTPLGAILGFVGLLKESTLQKDLEVTHFLSIIDRNSHHLLRIVDDILDLTKVEAGKMTIEIIEFALVEFLADFASLAGMKARENGINFEFNSEMPLPEFINSDPTRMRQILSNVVGNAIKFTEKGQVELKVSYSTNRLEFRVIDTGRGISEEQSSSLFQAFSQADSSTTRKFGGTGLGLVLTKKLSQALGGDFRLVESAIGKGSTFDVSIPVIIPDKVKFIPIKTVRIEPKINSEDSTHLKLEGLRILLVEDSPDNQFLIQKLLEKTGSIISVANNGAEGLAMALAQEFDVILMDIQMPIMDGHTAVEALRAKNYKGPIVALTAHAMKEEIERATQSGFSHFLSKPINRKNLMNLLGHIHSPLDLKL